MSEGHPWLLHQPPIVQLPAPLHARQHELLICLLADSLLDGHPRLQLLSAISCWLSATGCWLPVFPCHSSLQPSKRPIADRTCYTDPLVGAWRSPVAHRYGVPVVGGSNPLAPTLSPRQARATRGRFVVLSDFHDGGSIAVVGPWSGARRAGLRR